GKSDNNSSVIIVLSNPRTSGPKNFVLGIARLFYSLYQWAGKATNYSKKAQNASLHPKYREK
ncbi:17776_t:CDS:2, partial [Dentiscutata erythropus]